jgi:lysophospholipase L1-like esterase
MRIAFLGDSLTEGWPGAAFFPLLERRLPQHELHNRGKAGDTVADLWARLRREGLDPVDAAFLWVGANDAVVGAWDGSAPGSDWSWPERLARLGGDYEELLDWMAARTSTVFAVRPIVLESEGSLWERHAADVSEAIGRVAEGRVGCRLLDLRPAFEVAAGRGSGPFTTDGVHFTEDGAQVVAAAFAEVIAEIETEHVQSREAGPAAHAGPAPDGREDR